MVVETSLPMKEKGKKGSRAAEADRRSTFILVLIVALVVLETVGGSYVILSAYYNQTRMVHLTVIGVGCDTVSVVPNHRYSNVYVFGCLQSNTISLPRNSNVSVSVNLSPGEYVVGWWSSGGAVAGGGSDHELWLIVSADGAVAVVASLNQSLAKQ